MKAMALSDLIIMRRALAQMMGIFLVVAVFVAASTGSIVAATAALAVMSPAMFVISIAAYDQFNHWESFRLSLPLNRADVVKGRYASTTLVVAGSFVFALVVSVAIAALFTPLSDAGLLGPFEYNPSSLGEITAACALGLAVSLWIPAISLPLSLRFGLTRMTRLAPVVVAFAIAIAFTALSNLESSSGIVAWLLGAWVFDFLATGETAVIAVLAAVGVSAAVFAASLPIALRLYKTREF